MKNLIATLLGSIVTAILLGGIGKSHADQRSRGLAAQNNSKPNIVFILTDDQDLLLGSVDYMPSLKRHITDQGTTFTRHYCTVALCCPSRVSLWTGRAAHNTNVTDVSPPYGGYPKFVQQGYNEDWLPLWMQSAGYNTYYVGKLFNALSISTYNNPYVSGFNGSEFLLDPYTYEYLNATFQRNHDPPKNYKGQYSTDLVTNKSFAFLDDAIAAEQPFFLTIAPMAPHVNMEMLGQAWQHINITAPIPAEKYSSAFPDAMIPRTPNFNPDQPSGVSWIATLPQQDEANIAWNDEMYRKRLRALQSVDEMIDSLFDRLTKANLLDSTYVIFTSDHGYHIGQHRLQAGKSCGFEEDIHVPFVVRGPGVGVNQTSNIVTSHTDLAPTFLSLASANYRNDLDGIAMPLRNMDLGLSGFKDHESEHVNIEFWGQGLSEYSGQQYAYDNNTYKGLRLIGPSYNFFYTVWCNNEHELYDMNVDPYQISNIYYQNHNTTTVYLPTPDYTMTQSWSSTPVNASQIPLTRLLPRLDALLLILKSCKAETCRNPWLSLHPDNNVHSLLEALNPTFDNYYEFGLEEMRVSYSRCEAGLILSAEGAMGQNVISYNQYSAQEGHQNSSLASIRFLS